VAIDIVDRLGPASMPVIELGAGDGAITRELVRRGHSVTAVELDPRWVQALRQRFGDTARIVQADMLRYRFPREPYRVVSNVPYSITTPLLRTLFAERGWSDAVLMVQWEVARKRAGNGGGTLLSASWAPWYDVTLARRVPAQAFRPVPRVDSGVIEVTRRTQPLLAPADRSRYQRFVEAVFTGKGAGLVGVLRPYLTPRQVRDWARGHGVPAAALPKDLDAKQWVSLYLTIRTYKRHQV
jgi:23S rRNA (adenine-N6)-dimethyltransferase